VGAGSDEFVQLILECPGGGWTGDDINSLHKAEVDVLGTVAQDAEPSTPEALLPLVGPGVDAVDAFIACLRTDRPVSPPMARDARAGPSSVRRS
jgi:hypothetical protein